MPKKILRFFMSGIAVCFLVFSINFAIANTETAVTPASAVNSIVLYGNGADIKWTVDGYSKDGFKVVWSKNENPVYPSREGDKYHYLTDPSVRTDKLEPFSGSGVYYVRVCEYASGCGVYSNQIKVEFSNAATTIQNLTSLNSITLYSRESDVKWSVDGSSQNGFMVVWSKNENPAYPLRDGDKNDYLANPLSYYYAPDAFSGSGTYFVRVCEYRGGACEIFSNQVKVNLGAAEPSIACTACVGGIITDQEDPNGCPIYICPTTKQCPAGCICSEGTTACPEKKEVGGCTAEYSPVCGEVSIQCITTPCNPIWETFNNKCALVSKGAKYLYPGECRGAVVKEDVAVKWACYDGTEQVLTGECMKYGDWKMKAESFCADKCKGEKCGINSFSLSARCASANEIVNIEEKSKLLTTNGSNGLEAILAELKELRNLVKEQQAELKYLKMFVSEMKDLTMNMQDSIKSFITYGVDDNTKKLGEGERAAVINSFKQAYNKLPETESDMTDAIKIANGRWPSATSTDAESSANSKFKSIYGRDPDMNNPNDNAAVTIMAYGLRQKAENRKLESEANGLKIFEAIFKHMPSSTEEWNMLQAITYSGATK